MVKLAEFRDICGYFFKYPDEVQIVRYPKPGASGPTVVIVTDNGGSREYALKYGMSRVPIAEQLKNREILAPHFGRYLVPVLGSKIGIPLHDAAILMEAFDGNFHDIVVNREWSEHACIDFWKGVLETYGQLWRKTKGPFTELRKLKRHPVWRIHKVRDAVMGHRLPGFYRSLADYWYAPVVVNGHEYPNLDSVFGEQPSGYRPPRYVVMCHGDPNADNLLVKANEWAMGDWEWCGIHDWRLSASHLVGWWIANTAVELMQPTAFIDSDSRLILSYDCGLRTTTQALAREAYAAALRLAVEFREQDFSRQFSNLLSILLLGDIRFLDARGYSPRSAIYLLGEAVRMSAEGLEKILGGP